MGRWDRRRMELQDRLGELDARLHGIEAELDEPPSKDDEDRATEREGDEVLERIGAAGLQEIAMIKAALDRIARGDYGYCQRCGDEISTARLELLPETPFCRNCARDR